MRLIARLPVILAFIFCGIMITGKLMGFNAHPIVSGSMEPAMSTGSLAIVKSVPTRTLDTGDIIAYRSGVTGVNVAHRIVSIERNGGNTVIVTKGDANNSIDTDPYTTQLNSLDKVYTSIPKMGYVTSFLQTRQGVMILSALFALAFAVIFWPESKKKEEITNPKVVESE